MVGMVEFGVACTANTVLSLSITSASTSYHGKDLYSRKNKSIKSLYKQICITRKYASVRRRSIQHDDRLYFRYVTVRLAQCRYRRAPCVSAAVTIISASSERSTFCQEPCHQTTSDRSVFSHITSGHRALAAQFDH